MGESCTVYLVGGTDMAREGLRRILDDSGFAVHHSVGDIAELDDVEAAAQLIVVDGPSIEDPIHACAGLRGRFPSARLVLLADDTDLEVVARGFESGLDGYLCKTTPCGSLVGVLRLIMMGEKFMPSAAYQRLADLHHTSNGHAWDASGVARQLSEREIEILVCLAAGDSNKIIARKLDIAEATVKVHNKAILRKLQVLNRTQAAIWAINRGLAPQPRV